MDPYLLTKSTTFIIGPIATLMGYLMNGIFYMLDAITKGHANTGLAIILMTFVIYMAMMPLTVRQQRFAKLQNKMMPEIQKIQDKYKGKRDNDSMMKLNEETREVYAKYGVSPSGSCVQLLIQMPILFALYRVIYNFPAYVTLVRNAFTGIVDGLVNVIGIEKSAEILSGIDEGKLVQQFSRQLTNENFLTNVDHYAENTFIDILNRASTSNWNDLINNSVIKSNGLSEAAESTMQALEKFNNFLGLNIGNSPMYSIQNSGGKIGVIIVAVLIPILAALTQYLNVKLMPQAETSGNQNDTANSMASSMKTMNIMMPFMSAFFCLTLPAGLGLYWIAGAVIRSVQQVFINKHIDKLDIDAIVEKNMEKAKQKAKEKKRASKDYVNEKKVVEMATKTTKKISSNASAGSAQSASSAGSSYDSSKNNVKYKKGSLSAKANLVNRYNSGSSDSSGS